MTKRTSRLPRGLRTLLGVALLSVFVFFVGRAAVEMWRSAADARIVASPLTLAVTTGLTLAWLIALEAVFVLGVRKWMPGAPALPALRTAEVFFRSHLARYVPGKVVQLGTLAAGLMKLGFSGRQAAGAVVCHQGNFMLSTAVFAIGLAPLLWRAGFERGAGVAGAGAAAGIAAVAWLWIAQPRWAWRLAARVAPRLADEASAASATAGARAGVLFAYVALTAGQAATVAPLAAELAGVELDAWAWIALCGAYPVARLVGQLGVAIPGGLGVREGAYVLLALPIVGGPAGAAIAAWARLCALAAEAAVYLAALAASRRR